MSVKAIPEGYHSVTPYLAVRNATQAIEFYQAAFNAEDMGRLAMPDGTLMHGEFKIGNSHIMYCEENPQMGMVGPETLNGSGVTICLYVDDVDKTFAQAVAAGAESIRPVEDQFWGDRAGTLLDPYGHKWTVMTHIEDVDWGEVERRFEQMLMESN